MKATTEELLEIWTARLLRAARKVERLRAKLKREQKRSGQAAVAKRLGKTAAKRIFSDLMRESDK